MKLNLYKKMYELLLGLTIMPNYDYHNTITIREIPIIRADYHAEL